MDDNFHDDECQDEEAEGEPELMYGGRDGLIFLIDATSPMFEGGVPFKTCIECCKTTMLNKIISSDRDLVAVVLFGTSKTSNELKAAHITTLQELTEPSAEKIKELVKIGKSDNFDNFAAKFGHSNEFALSDALWLCQNIFSKSVCKLSSSRILLMTNTSNPHSGKPSAQHQARVRASDLAQAGIDLELLHMGDDFDANVFYKELIQLSKGDSGDDFELPDATSKIDELLERICRLDYKKRALTELTFNLGNDVAISVNMYTLVRKSTPPKSVALDQASNELVTSVTQRFNPVTAETLMPAEVCKTLTVANKHIVFSGEERRALRCFMDKGINLLRVVPRDKINIYNHLEHSAFIYPSENSIKGSRQVFAALLDRCAARSVVPVCYLTARVNSTPKMVALLPQLEEKKSNGFQVTPPGFHVVFLPFKDSIRPEEPRTAEEATSAQIALLEEMVSQLSFKYSGEIFENPMLQVHWSNIEALALDQPEPRQVIDSTKPNLVEMKKNLGDLVQQFLSLLYEEGYDPLPTTLPKKRAGIPVARGGKVPKP